MKNTNDKTYVTCPIAMMATIIAAAENSVHSDFQKEAELIAGYYNSLHNYSDLVICDVSYMELMTEEEMKKLLDFVLSKTDTIQSFATTKFNNETTVYKLSCAHGIFKMILVKDTDNKIEAIDFSKEKSFIMKNAA